jgi:2-hydroxycyclohexanecarboxyl-CoA dehydrogenase
VPSHRPGMSLKGHVALVTGAGDGIGAETARRLAEEAASVLAVDVNGNGAAATAADIEAKGGTASWMEADVSKAEDVANMVQRAVDTYGTISILVNNAYGSPPNGVSSAGSALDLDPAGWDFAMAIGLRSHFLAAKHALPHMIAAGGGSIVNISSVHGLCSARGNLAYSSLKAGVSTSCAASI